LSGSYPITVTGGGFSSTATLALTGCVTTDVALANAGTVQSSTTITDTVNVTAGVANSATCVLTVTNVAPGNLDSYSTAPGALGVGVQSTVAPLVTASSLSTAAAVSPGAPAQAITFTGEGFSQFTTPTQTTAGVTTVSDPDASIGTSAASCLGGQTGTTLTCELTVTSGATSGAHSADVVTLQLVLPVATVAGPTLTSATPAALAVNAAYGTTIAITGSGFTPTIVTTTVGGGTGLAGVLTYVSATSLTFTVTTPPTSSGTATITVTEDTGSGTSVLSNALSLPIDLAPSISGLTYATAPTNDVGVGATAQTITIAGANFQTGATITKFTNGNGVADPLVTATVTKVTPTAITATIAVGAGDTNTADGYTITNPDGGHGSPRCSTRSSSALVPPSPRSRLPPVRLEPRRPSRSSAPTLRRVPL
jgi:hypothetical protein